MSDLLSRASYFSLLRGRLPVTVASTVPAAVMTKMSQFLSCHQGTAATTT